MECNKCKKTWCEACYAYYSTLEQLPPNKKLEWIMKHSNSKAIKGV